MYKTTWLIIDKTDDTKTEFTYCHYYHFGKEPRFPSWYMEANHVYNIKMICNFKLSITPTLFFNCLFHHYKIA